jgi:hypothetical protein
VSSIDIEVPSVAQIHRAAIEKAALRLAAGESIGILLSLIRQTNPVE